MADALWIIALSLFDRRVGKPFPTAMLKNEIEYFFCNSLNLACRIYMFSLPSPSETKTAHILV